jgi:hypothetical protein
MYTILHTDVRLHDTNVYVCVCVCEMISSLLVFEHLHHKE